ncbi:MAG: glutamate--tRNA ligase family protein [Candidatus Limnocylindrales bacterium]
MSAGRSSCAWRTRTQARSTLEYEKDILDGLHWLGLAWDEGPEVAGQEARGPHAPYRQMERLPSYAAAARRLLADDLAYPCFCTPEQLDADRKGQEAAKLPPRYVGSLRDVDLGGPRRLRGGRPSAARCASGSGRASSPSMTSSADTSRSTSRIWAAIS